MDRNTVIGFILILIILVVYSLYNYQTLKEQQEQAEQQKREQPAADTAQDQQQEAVSDQQSADSQQDTARATSSSATSDTSASHLKREFGPFADAASGSIQYDTIENEKMVIVLANKGANIHKVRLKDYERYDSLPLVLFEGQEEYRMNYQFFLSDNRSIQTKDLYFTSENGSFLVSGDEQKTFTYRVKLGPDQYLEQKYVLRGNSNLLDYEVNFINLDQYLSPTAKTLNLSWEQDIRKLEKHMTSARRYSALYYKYLDDDIEHLSQSGTADYGIDKPLKWISYKQQFFNTTLIAKEGNLERGEVSSTTEEDSKYVKTMKSNMELPLDPGMDNQYAMQLYIGPNKYNTLAKVGHELEDIIPLAPDFFLFGWVSFINKWLIIPLFNFLNSYFMNFGIIILILTLLIKTILFPLTYRSYKSMAKMKVIQPEIQELKEKYGDDQQKFGTEQWKLFQKAGVNPLGGCLPMLLQMPILIAMYYFFPSSIELRQEGFLWATDLSTYDSILDLGFTIPLYGDHVSLFTVLMFVSSILYAATNPQMSGGGGSGMQAQMKYMPYIFPFMLLFIFNSFPAALTYYYFLANMITYAQQFIIKRFIVSEEQLHEQIQEKKKQPVKKSKFQQRLEDIAKQQQEKQQAVPKKKKKKK